MSSAWHQILDDSSVSHTSALYMCCLCLLKASHSSHVTAYVLSNWHHHGLSDAQRFLTEGKCEGSWDPKLDKAMSRKGETAQKMEAETAFESRCSRLEVRATWNHHLGTMNHQKLNYSLKGLNYSDNIDANMHTFWPNTSASWGITTLAGTCGHHKVSEDSSLFHSSENNTNKHGAWRNK